MVDLRHKRIKGKTFEEYLKVSPIVGITPIEVSSRYLKTIGLIDYFDKKSFTVGTLNDITYDSNWKKDFGGTLPPDENLSRSFGVNASFRNYFVLNLALNFYLRKEEEQLEFDF